MRLGISALLFNLDKALELCREVDRINHIEVGIDNLDECIKLSKYKGEFEKLNLSLGIHLPMELNSCENIEYIRSGENIAAGQINAIYAHEALMNSLGHRKNILGNYDNIGVGVSFGGHYKIYYTQNFYSE